MSALPAGASDGSDEGSEGFDSEGSQEEGSSDDEQDDEHAAPRGKGKAAAATKKGAKKGASGKKEGAAGRSGVEDRFLALDEMEAFLQEAEEQAGR